MNTLYEPLKTHPRAVILDTDIGPDCDDVGALVALLYYADIYGFPILGLCNCTSNRAGTGTLDALTRFAGLELPLGQWSHPGFLDDPSCHIYNDDIACRFSEAFRNGTLNPEKEIPFYRRLLASSPDQGVTLITIGMFNNLAALLTSPPDDISPLSGKELIRRKVYAVVSMAGILPEGREYNLICDPVSARTVFSDWPTPLILSDFHIGRTILTGYPIHAASSSADGTEEHPAEMAYRLYSGVRNSPIPGTNASFDLTAVQFAVEGEGEFYGLGDAGRIEFYAGTTPGGCADSMRFIPDETGSVRFLCKKAPDSRIADSLNAILQQYKKAGRKEPVNR